MSGREGELARAPARTREAAAHVARWSAPAWGAIGVTALFLVITCWWLARDAAVPFGSGAANLYAAVLFHEGIFRGLGLSTYYPPAIRVLGAAAYSVGGMRVASAVLAQNLVFVPLLALACYRVGCMAASRRAGLLAVVFALGSPLLAEQFHNFMLDAPTAALVAAAVWLILASDRFERVGHAALAGLVVGVGLLTKQLVFLYLVGFVVAVLARGGGWRNRRGLLAFAGVALLVAGPWYVGHHGDWGRWIGAAGSGESGEPVPPAASPPLLSLANAGWYVWGTLNGLLFAALFSIALIGVVATAVRVLRTRPRPLDDANVELLWGLAGGWLAITLLRHKDVRYTLPLIVYLSVLGTAWIARLRPRAQALATAALVAAVLLAQAGATFGVGRSPDQLPLSNGALHDGEGVPPRERVVFYSSLDYLLSGPQRDGDVLTLMRGLHAAGARRVVWEDHGDLNDHRFEAVGLIVFARIAGLSVEGFDPPAPGATMAHLIRAAEFDGTPPCTSLGNGDGIWVQIGRRDACPGA